jgi:tRNA threonylcarbamoyladenosine biosynthesis protein TsaE
MASKISDGTKYVSGSEKDTFNFAKKFARSLKGGKVIGLIGDLGAGKTVFAKGLASGLGIRQKITSPTFVLMRVYPIKKKDIKNLVHIDAYRLKSTADLEAIGAEEYMNDPEAIVLIEWADRVVEIMPKNVTLITIKTDKGEQKRIINI